MQMRLTQNIENFHFLCDKWNFETKFSIKLNLVGTEEKFVWYADD